MAWIRYGAIASLVLGVGILALAVMSRGSPEVVETPDFLAVAESPRALPSRSAVPSPVSTVTVMPTPTPFDGPVQRLLIPRFGVDSTVEPIGLVPGANQLDAPKDPLNTGWYEIYDRPGFGGNAVFSAHVDYYPNIKGPFYNLAKAEAGDEILVEMANAQTYTYRVFFKQRYDVASIPMGELIEAPSKPEGAEWITLITCGGRFRALNPDGSGPGEYLDRNVVIAERVDG
ncbi:MAG: class F sortase [Dehalococcoidia bacterium]|nr:class F sortase [Dehalococcoidia bacterium]MCZ7579145.1 class F sortase [Dehalococcoidia bacterium]